MSSKPQVAWSVVVDKYAKVIDTKLKPGAKYKMIVLSNELQFVPTVPCGSSCCAKGYTLPLAKVEALWEVPAQYSQKSLVIQLKPDEYEEGAVENTSLPYHKFWVEGDDETLGACAAKIQSMRRLRAGDVIVSGYLDSLTCSPTFFPSNIGVLIFKANTMLRTAVVGQAETIPVEGGAVTVERKAFGTEATFTASAPEEGEDEPKTGSVFCENVEGPILTLNVEEEMVKPEEGKPYKKYSLLKPGSAAKPKTLIFNIAPTTILSAEYVAGLGGIMPEKKGRTRSLSRSKAKNEAKKPAEPAPPKTGMMGKIKRGLSLQKAVPPVASASAPEPAAA
mmetsp:Transcript_55023/g.120025  ORF Transcript_55023/g.120025 Transcript_55023/m.120025 type:complete len:335 (-) Transcript_55023:730-1734(-)